MLVIIGDNMAEEVETVTLVDTKSLVLTQDAVKQAVNNKEDFEVINGAFLGNHIYEEFASLRQLKLAKIIDMF